MITAAKLDVLEIIGSDFEFINTIGVNPSFRRRRNFEVHQSAPRKTIVDKLEEFRLNNNSSLMYPQSPSSSVLSYSEIGPIILPRREEGSKSSKKIVYFKYYFFIMLE